MKFESKSRREIHLVLRSKLRALVRLIFFFFFNPLGEVSSFLRFCRFDLFFKTVLRYRDPIAMSTRRVTRRIFGNFEKFAFALLATRVNSRCIHIHTHTQKDGRYVFRKTGRIYTHTRPSPKAITRIRRAP